MSQPVSGAEGTTTSIGVMEKIRDFIHAFTDLFDVPHAFWFINVVFMLDSMAYFGILTLMTAYLAPLLALRFAMGPDSSDWSAGLIVALFTGLVTLLMLGAGLVERMGVRRGLLWALVLCLGGRILYTASPVLPGNPLLLLALFVGLLLIAIGEAIVQPLAYAGIKQYTNDKTSAMGYGLLYAVMNLGIFFIGLISPLVRVPLDKIMEARAAGSPEPASIWRFLANWSTSGFMGVHWVCTAVTALALLFLLVFLTRRVEANKIRPPEVQPLRGEGEGEVGLLTRVKQYFVEGPFGDARFIFFIFMLLPVQTLFAHQWLTMSPYILRVYSQGVADRMEWLVNWINPGIIFFGVPIATALTRRVNVYTMMIVGSLVSAVPTFLLCTGPHLSTLITYLVLFSVGEALWSPRFLQYAAELAPEGKVSQYMGLANIPWLAAKMTTGLYSGAVLAKYCPEHGHQDTQTMWLIYGIIAMTSPVGLWLARRWVMSGLQQKLKPVPA